MSLQRRAYRCRGGAGIRAMRSFPLQKALLVFSHEHSAAHASAHINTLSIGVSFLGHCCFKVNQHGKHSSTDPN